ncbi:MAG: hypothetical protein M9962_09235 [Oligoflexia bacterium]|nr:hypothetical protein [Oligoflexia bacterium]
MMIPEQPKNSIRITLELNQRAPRLDSLLLEAIKTQVKNLELKHISRSKFKTLFDEKRIQIKGQPARPASSIAKGTTYIDILGFSEEE